MTTPKELDAITDVVLAYKPTPKTKAASAVVLQVRQTQRPILNYHRT